MAMAFGCHIIAINVITFFVYGVDKLKARVLMVAHIGEDPAFARCLRWQHRCVGRHETVAPQDVA